MQITDVTSPDYLLPVIILVIVAVVALCYLMPLFVVRPNWLDEAKLIELREESRKTLIHLFAALGVVISFGYTMLKDADTRARAVRQQATGHIKDAVELLAKSDPSARSGALLVLAKAAETDPGGALFTMGIVQSHLRNEAQRPKEPRACFARPVPITADIQTAINILDHRAIEGQTDFIGLAQGRIELRRAYLAKATFERTKAFAGAIFEQALMFGVNMRGADLRGTRFGGTNFDDWKAYGNCNDKGEHRTEPMEPMLRTFRGDDDWKRYEFGADFTDAHLEGANFQGAGLTGAIFHRAYFDDATDFRRANIGRADFRESNVTIKLLRQACADDMPVLDDRLKKEFQEYRSANNGMEPIKRCS